jgi:flavin-dependent dehydrogenase
MNNGNDYDFIIIGSGAGGGTLAYHLALAARKFYCSSAGLLFRARKRIGIPWR